MNRVSGRKITDQLIIIALFLTSGIHLSFSGKGTATREYIHSALLGIPFVLSIAVAENLKILQMASLNRTTSQ